MRFFRSSVDCRASRMRGRMRFLLLFDCFHPNQPIRFMTAKHTIVHASPASVDRNAHQWYIEMAELVKNNNIIENAQPRLPQMCSYWLRRWHKQKHHHKIPNIDLIITNYCCLFYNCQLLCHPFRHLRRPSAITQSGHTDAAGLAVVGWCSPKHLPTKYSIVVESIHADLHIERVCIYTILHEWARFANIHITKYVHRRHSQHMCERARATASIWTKPLA